MPNRELGTLHECLLNIESHSETAWVFLPGGQEWHLGSVCAVAPMDEVPPEHERDPDAGVPAWVKGYGLVETLEVPIVQDIVRAVLAQRPNASTHDLFRAFMFYFRHDAFIDFTRAQG